MGTPSLSSPGEEPSLAASPTYEYGKRFNAHALAELAASLQRNTATGQLALMDSLPTTPGEDQSEENGVDASALREKLGILSGEQLQADASNIILQAPTPAWARGALVSTHAPGPVLVSPEAAAELLPTQEASRCS